jgi:hypothetical protein
VRSARFREWCRSAVDEDDQPTDPSTGELVAGGVVAQAEQVRRSLEAVLAPFGLTLDDARRVTLSSPRSWTM